MPTAGADDVVAGLAAAVDELYSLRPEEFTGRRDERAKAARAAGDKALAAALRRLRRPTTSAWALNLLSRQEADLVGQLLELGESLREAQTGLDGAALRELDKQRRGVVGALARRAGELAEENGHPLDAAQARQVEQSLGAAMTDPDAGSAVTSGQLTTPVSVVGFGVEVGPDAVAVPTLVLVGSAHQRSTSSRHGGRPQRSEPTATTRAAASRTHQAPRVTAPAAEPDSLAEARARREQERREREREARRAEVRDALETARAAEAETEQSARQAADEVTRLRARLDELTAEREELVARLHACEEETASTTARLAEEQQRQDDADHALLAARRATRRAERQAEEAGADDAR